MLTLLLAGLVLVVVGVSLSAGEPDYARDPVAFIDAFLKKNEKGQPFSLSEYQRRVIHLAFVFDGSGRLTMRLLLWSEPKKSGKTFIAAALGLWWAITRSSTEVIVAANDQEQSVGRVFKTMAALCKHNGLERAKVVKVKAATIECSNGTVITAIASEYAGAAGSRHSLWIGSELWAFSSERAMRLYEELTPPPTEPDAWCLIETYAGFVGESKLLESLYERGVSGERVDDELPVYRSGEMVAFWSHEPRQAWQTPEYYAEQRRSLRPNTYLRLHENRWVSSESRFITAEQFDACVELELSPVLVDRELEVSVGVDAALKNDCAAVVAVAWDGDHLRLVSHRVWRPTKAEPLDLEATIESYVRDLHRKFNVREVAFDPWQFVRSAAILRAEGVPMRELPQTPANLTAMASTLWEVIDGRNLRLDPADDLREHVLNAVAIETARGLKLAKEKASRKVDAAVALAMACVSAVEHGPDDVPLMLISDEPDSAFVEWQGARGDEVPEPVELSTEAQEQRDRVEASMTPRDVRRRRFHDNVEQIASRGAGWMPGDAP